MFKNVLFKIYQSLLFMYNNGIKNYIQLKSSLCSVSHRVERIPICSFKIRSCFNAAHASWWMIFIFISLHSNKLYFLDTLSYY